MPNARRLVEATGGAQNRTPAWRRALDWRTPGWCHEAGVHWERWSLNGEACITGLDPPFAGGARLASCLTWLVRAFASHCRRTHDATGAFAVTCTGRRMPSTLALTMSGSFAARDERLAELAPSAQATGLPGAWHALWRLPPAMTWTEPGGKPWIRYPAVSFVAAVRPLQ